MDGHYRMRFGPPAALDFLLTPGLTEPATHKPLLPIDRRLPSHSCMHVPPPLHRARARRALISFSHAAHAWEHREKHQRCMDLHAYVSIWTCRGLSHLHTGIRCRRHAGLRRRSTCIADRPRRRPRHALIFLLRPTHHVPHLPYPSMCLRRVRQGTGIPAKSVSAGTACTAQLSG